MLPPYREANLDQSPNIVLKREHTLKFIHDNEFDWK